MCLADPLSNTKLSRLPGSDVKVGRGFITTIGVTRGFGLRFLVFPTVLSWCPL